MNRFSAKYRMARFLASYVAVFVVLAILGHYAAVKIGFIKPPAVEIQAFATDLSYVDLPRINVAVMSDQGTTHVRLDISLEVAKKDVLSVERFEPSVTDKLNAYFSHISPEMFTRIQSTPELRADLLRQVNGVGMPPVHDLLFREMVVM